MLSLVRFRLGGAGGPTLQVASETGKMIIIKKLQCLTTAREVRTTRNHPYERHLKSFMEGPATSTAPSDPRHYESWRWEELVAYYSV